MHIFAVDEVHKQRRRLIAHTIDINNFTVDCVAPEDKMFSDIRDIVDAHIDCENRLEAWTCDLAAFYHQIELAPEARSFYAFPFEHDNRITWYQLKTIATGQRHCVWRAQCLAKVLARMLHQEMQIHSEGPDYRIGCLDVYIDDFLFADKSSVKVRQSAKVFRNICKQFHITTNEISIGANFTHRGVTFEYKDGTRLEARVAEKTQHKLRQAHHNLMESASQWTFSDAQTVFGLLQYCSRIYRLPLHPYFYIFKFMRRRASSGIKQDELAQIWPCTVAIWKDWLEKCLSECRRGPQERQNIFTIVSDASDTGWGAYVFWNDTAVGVCAPWSDAMISQHINVKEIFAVLFAVKSTNVPEGSSLKIIVDNTSSMYCLRKTRSNNFLMNKCLEWLKNYTIQSADYIQSEQNPADTLSRMCN